MSRRTLTQSPIDDDGTSPTLPSLDPGLHLIDVDTRAVGTIQSLVIEHVLTQGPTGSTAAWVDSNGMATTSTLTRLVPSMRLLDRIRVARAFTPYQHHTLVSRLPDVVDDHTSFIVVPEFEYHYRSQREVSELSVEDNETAGYVMRGSWDEEEVTLPADWFDDDGTLRDT